MTQDHQFIRTAALLCLVLLAAGTASALYPDRDGVVLDMRFNNDSGVGEAYSNPSDEETVYDYSDAQNNGTTKNNITYNDTGGIWDGAFEFDGDDDFITLPTIENNFAANYSVFAWAKRYDLSGGTDSVFASITDVDFDDDKDIQLGFAKDAGKSQTPHMPGPLCTIF